MVRLPTRSTRLWLGSVTTLGGRCQKHRRVRRGRAGPTGGSNLKIAFGALVDPGVMRTPPACRAVRKWCLRAFPMVSLPTRFASDWLCPLSALGGRCRKHRRPRRGKGRARGGSNLKFAIGALGDPVTQILCAPLRLVRRSGNNVC